MNIETVYSGAKALKSNRFYARIKGNDLQGGITGRIYERARFWYKTVRFRYTRI